MLLLNDAIRQRKLMSSSIEIGYPFKVQKRAQNEIYRVALKGCASRGEPTQTAARMSDHLPVAFTIVVHA